MSVPYWWREAEEGDEEEYRRPASVKSETDKSKKFEEAEPIQEHTKEKEREQ